MCDLVEFLATVNEDMDFMCYSFFCCMVLFEIPDIQQWCMLHMQVAGFGQFVSVGQLARMVNGPVLI